jgi:hypothetical protein
VLELLEHGGCRPTSKSRAREEPVLRIPSQQASRSRVSGSAARDAAPNRSKCAETARSHFCKRLSRNAQREAGAALQSHSMNQRTQCCQPNRATEHCCTEQLNHENDWHSIRSSTVNIVMPLIAGALDKTQELRQKAAMKLVGTKDLLAIIVVRLIGAHYLHMLQWQDCLVTIIWIACENACASVNAVPSPFVLDIHGLCHSLLCHA